MLPKFILGKKLCLIIAFVVLMFFRESNESRVAFVDFSQRNDALASLKLLIRKRIDGCSIKAEWKRTDKGKH